MIYKISNINCNKEQGQHFLSCIAMLRLNSIIITQFKNYQFSSFAFKERVIGICGLNGRGKTNLLDAIYYCCFTKSYFSKTDGLSIQFSNDGFRLEAASSISPKGGGNGEDHSEEYEKQIKQYEIVCIYKGAGKKEIFLNAVPYTKLSEHIGKFPAVMVAPDDIELITGGSEERRRFMDTVLSEMDADYLQHLIKYNKVLLQRNSLLKRFAEQGKTDWPLLEVLDEQLVEPGNSIHQKRKQTVISSKVESLNYCQTKIKNKRHDGWLKWRRKPISKVEIRSNLNQPKTIRQGKTADLINRAPKRITIKIKGQDICKLF